MKLLIVSHVVHYEEGARLYAYGPYAREVDVWAELFSEVAIAAPCRKERAPGDCLPFARRNISIIPQRETGGETWRAKLRQIILLPLLVFDLVCAMRRADAIHIRCPGNLGLLGAILAPFFSKFLVAKYAGQWTGYPGETWSVRLQRRLLRSSWWRGPVTVYGAWPDQPTHIIPFFTSIMTREQMMRAGRSAVRRRSDGKLRVLYVGRLTAAKNVEAVLSALARLRDAQRDLSCTIVGDGPRRARLIEMVKELRLEDRVTFAGSVGFARALDLYDWAHVLVLVYETEGWPKAIAEAMAFGLICIGSDRGLIPQMLADGRGIVVPPGDAQALATALADIAAHPASYDAMRARAVAWAERFSLDDLRDALRHLLSSWWDVELAGPVIEAHDRIDTASQIEAGEPSDSIRRSAHARRT
ncbi:MAG: glycosyltransferase family 4 protein [Pyrinomonas methylaliphatogenes]|nr:glycosyltransferase family 4 protein [Pyrinomonas methylaliphatogenes]